MVTVPLIASGTNAPIEKNNNKAINKAFPFQKYGCDCCFGSLFERIIAVMPAIQREQPELKSFSSQYFIYRKNILLMLLTNRLCHTFLKTLLHLICTIAK